MTDVRVLLERHRPRLVYDSHEAYFADSAAIWTDSPHERAQARRRHRHRQAAAAEPGVPVHVYARQVDRHDRRHHARLRQERRARCTSRPKYANRVHGHARKDAQGRLWLQYWLFYYYNDYQLLGPLSGGNHEGDWELVQLRLDAAEKPAQLVFSQHKQAESKAWRTRQGGRDADRLRRARLARQLLRQGHALDGQLVRPGRRQGPADHARARGARGPHARVGAVARLLGRHEAGLPAAGLLQPASAPACARTGWIPSKLKARRGPRRPRRRRPRRRAPPCERSARARRRPLRRARERHRAGRRAAAEGLRRARRHPRHRPRTPAAASSSCPRTIASTTSGRASSTPTGSPPKVPRRSDRHREPVRVASPPRGGRRDRRRGRHLQRP